MNPPPKIAIRQEAAAARSRKRAEKKLEFARDAIQTLSQLGYAQTSLRDIAAQAGVSVGVIHYYFEDKIDLITYCVDLYKQDFIAQLEDNVAAATTVDQIIGGLVSGLADALENDAGTHRLWYDIRAQALFDENFRDTVFEIETALIAFVDRLFTRLAKSGVDITAVDARTAYLFLDGLFRFHLQIKLSGDSTASAKLRQATGEFFQMIAPA